MKKSIRSRLLVGTILPVVVGILVLIVVSVFLVRNNVSRMTEQVISSQTSDIYFKIEGYLDKCISSINTYANTSEIANVFTQIDNNNDFSRYNDKENIVNNLTKFKSISSDISNYWIADLNASQVLYDDAKVSDKNYKLNEQDWFNQLMIKKETTLTSPYVNPKTSDEVISIVTMVKLNAFQNIGVVGLDIPTDVFKAKINDFRDGNNNNLTIISEDGMILYDDNEENIGHEVHTTHIDGKVISAFDSKISGDINYKVDGNEYVGSILKSESTGITMITGMPSKLFFKAVNSLMIFLISIGTLILLVVLVVIIIMAKNIVGPIKYLEKVSNQIADGNLEVEINYNEDNEIGNLATSLKKTVDRLNTYIKHIDDISYNLDKIAAGDFNIDIDTNVEGAFVKIQNSLNNIRIKLSHTIRKVVETSEEINYSANQLTDGAQSLSESSIEQASSVDILSESIVQITAEIEKTTEFTDKAYSISKDTIETADLGSEQMSNLLLAMNEIMSVSNKIGKIVHTIEDIAFQTNTLSLNASIEAARAGDAGLGFAVVAGEVRKLANKTSIAARETSDLIKSSLKTVTKGNRLCDVTSQSLQEILEYIKIQADIVEKIDLASKTQKNSINQIEEGIISISAAVQTNSATAEEAAASSEELSSQASNMFEMMEEFILYDGDNEIIENVEKNYCEHGDEDSQSEIDDIAYDSEDLQSEIDDIAYDSEDSQSEIDDIGYDSEDSQSEIDDIAYDSEDSQSEIDDIGYDSEDSQFEVEEKENELNFAEIETDKLIEKEINRAYDISIEECFESTEEDEEVSSSENYMHGKTKKERSNGL